MSNGITNGFTINDSPPDFHMDQINAEAMALVNQDHRTGRDKLPMAYELPQRRTIADMFNNPIPLPPPVIEGLMVKREVHKIVSDSKAKKTWLAMLISLSVATGRKLFDRWQCRMGRVLHLDAELLQGGIEDRFVAIAKAMGITPVELIDHNNEPLVDVRSLREYPASLNDLLVALPASFNPGEFSLVVLDSLYRFYGDDEDENSNGKQTALFAKLTQLAAKMDCAIMVVHHSTKGDQSQKKVQDVGSGAGAQSRFADGLIAVREHEYEGCALIEGLTRHHIDPTPLTIQWEYPLWIAKEGIKPVVKQHRSADKQERQEKRELAIEDAKSMFAKVPFTANDLKKVGIDYRMANSIATEMRRNGEIAVHSHFRRKGAKASSDHFTFQIPCTFDSEFDAEMYQKLLDSQQVQTTGAKQVQQYTTSAGKHLR